MSSSPFRKYIVFHSSYKDIHLAVVKVSPISPKFPSTLVPFSLIRNHVWACYFDNIFVNLRFVDKIKYLLFIVVCVSSARGSALSLLRQIEWCYSGKHRASMFAACIMIMWQNALSLNVSLSLNLSCVHGVRVWRQQKNLKLQKVPNAYHLTMLTYVTVQHGNRE